MDLIFEEHEYFNNFNDNENYQECCFIKNCDTCETLEESFHNLIFTIDDESSVELAPTRDWNISSKSESSDFEVLDMCKILFSPHRVAIRRTERRNRSDGRPIFDLHINHRINMVEMCNIFENHKFLRVEKRGFLDEIEINFWRNYVLKNYPHLYNIWINDDDDDRNNDDDDDWSFLFNKSYSQNNFFQNNSTNVLNNEYSLSSKDFGNLTISSSNNAKEKNIREEFLCRICLVNCFDHAIIPCGHTLCKKCSEHFHEVCPNCRGHVNRMLKIYY